MSHPLRSSQCNHQIDNSYNGQKPELLRRYIDDILGATSLELSELNKYIDFVQGFHPALEYSFDITDQSLPFLDIALFIDGDHIETSVHYKPTDTHSYLYNSSHPRLHGISEVEMRIFQLKKFEILQFQSSWQSWQMPPEGISEVEI